MPESSRLGAGNAVRPVVGLPMVAAQARHGYWECCVGRVGFAVEAASPGPPSVEEPAPVSDPVPDPVPRRVLLAVHAHPDDESSKGAGTLARYADEGVRTVVVTCTGGEAGEILNPAMDLPGTLERMPELRRQELAKALAVLGVAGHHWLGYRDSGMPGTETNRHPDAFSNAPLDQAVGRLVRIIRAERPQV